MTAAVPRFVLLPILAVLGTATLTFAADTQISGTKPSAALPPQQQAVLVVPDVRRQVYVFAKGTLEDAGFAWRVTGRVRGYAANLVAGQNPSPGIRVLDTGAPTIVLTLVRNPQHAERGVPENAAPFRGTEIRIAGVRARPKQPARPAPKVKAKAKPKPDAAPQKRTKTTKAPARKPSRAARPPAFRLSGAPREPLDEMPLPARARLLDRYVRAHPTPTDAVVKHFLYQHAWIVTGARFGWWRGEQALERLVAVDRRVRRLWGIGARNERVARAALRYVRARS